MNLPDRRGAGFAVLLGAAFAVSMAFGVTMPLLPSMLGRFIVSADASEVARHTGWLTAVYTLAMLALSPAWGALSDRIDRRLVMLVGLVGGAVALLGLDFVENLAGLYAARIGAGVFSAAVLPAVLGAVVDMTAPGERPKRFGALAAATAVGFLAGPAVGSVLASMVIAPPAGMRLGGWLMLDSPFLVVAVISLLVAAALVALPGLNARHAQAANAPTAQDRPALRRAFLLTGLIVFGITIMEVGVTLLGTQIASIGVRGVSAYFALCSLVMVSAQLWAYPRLASQFGERGLLMAAFLGMALGLALLPVTHEPWLIGIAVTLGALGVGILIPALATCVSAAAGSRQGLALGLQTAAANAGQAVAAAATGMLYAGAAAAPFIVGAALMAWAAWLAGRHDAVRPMAATDAQIP